MPIVYETPRGFNQYSPKPPADPAEPGFSETWSSAFELENDVAALSEYSSHTFKSDPTFQVRQSLQQYDSDNGTSFFDNYSHNFLGVESNDEMLYKINKITSENRARDTLDRAGWTGYVASVTAGLASPLTFVPMVNAGTRSAQILKMASLGMATGVTSELLLQGTHETRTPGESLLNIASSTALMGILGAITPTLSPVVRKSLEKDLETAAESIAKRPQPGGAAVNEEVSFADLDAGSIASGAQNFVKAVDRVPVFANPVTQNIMQEDLQSIRQITQQLGDAGLAMERSADVAAAPGGTLENRIGVYNGQLNEANEVFNKAYADYFFNQAPPKLAANARAVIGGFLSKTKLSKSEFAEEVTKAIWMGYQSAIPEVQAVAKEIADKLFQPILEQAQKVKLLSDDLEVVGDKAYAQRIYNTEAISRKTAKFVNLLARNYEKQLGARFQEEMAKLEKKQSQLTQQIEDMQRPGDEAEQMLKQFREDLDFVNTESVPEDVFVTEELAADLRSQARLAQQAGDKAKAKQLKADARAMDKLGGKELQDLKIARADVRRRIRNLNASRALFDAKRAAKLEKIELIDEQNIAALGRLAKTAQKLLNKIDKLSDKELDKELAALWKKFAGVNERFDKAQGRVEKLETEFETGQTAAYVDEAELIAAAKRADRVEAQIPGARDRFQKASDALDRAAARVEEAENFDRVEARAAIQDALNGAIEKVNEVNSRRAVRQAKLKQDAAKLKPEDWEAQLAKVKSKQEAIGADFATRWGDLSTGLDMTAKKANFADKALENALIVKDKIMGTYLGLPFTEILAMERGPELQRVLDIPSTEMAEFLETDIRNIMKSYTRTMAPDIEIYQRFGSMDWAQIIKPAADERNAKIMEIEASDLSEAAKMKETKRLNDSYDRGITNLKAMIQRLRNQRGIPSNPEGFAYRAARAIMDLNTLRFMGMVTIASFPDMGRPVMKYGLTRTFRDGFGPLVSNLKAFKLNAREARLSGAAIEVSSSSRAMAIRDVLDDMERGSPFEKALNWTTNKIGLVALFDYWTQGMKLMTSSIANAKMMDALAVVNEAGGSMTKAEAQKYLNILNINGERAVSMWNEVVENGGGGKVDGVWWPNTESWKDRENIMAYRQALHREINSTIIQPGIERPLLSDANTLGRMLYQFKSFGMSATPKIMAAGMQQRDAAVLSGSLASLGLGALSYYTWAVMTGGASYQQMLDADLDKWADEAIQRSGLIGGLGEVQRVGQNIPLISDYMSFSGTKSTRRPGDNLVEALLGPSFDFGQSAAQVIGGLHDPTRSTLHEFRKMLPFQNTMFLREAIDAVEGAAGSYLPERRK